MCGGTGELGCKINKEQGEINRGNQQEIRNEQEAQQEELTGGAKHNMDDSDPEVREEEWEEQGQPQPFRDPLSGILYRPRLRRTTITTAITANREDGGDEEQTQEGSEKQT